MYLKCLIYSKLYHKSISENRLQLYVKEKKVKEKLRRGKMETFTLNLYILNNFTSNMYIILLILVIINLLQRFLKTI